MMTSQETPWQIFTLLSKIYLKSRRLAEKSLNPLNITWPQFGALLHLSRGDNITQKELATRLEGDTTTTMVLCDSLEKKGWLKRVKDPSDRRVNRLKITPNGNAVFSMAYPLVMAKYKILVEGISSDKLQDALPVLTELYDVIKRQYQEQIR
jgi:MarR family transcriptional regulator for hemolysin